MWFSASTKHFVGMNRFGKLEKIIDLGDRFILHHDYALDDDGNIVSLATDLTRYDHAVQDQAIKVNTSTGKVTKLVDFGEMFPDYKASTDHSGIDESDPTASGRWDWIHFNTIHLLPDGQYYIYMFDNDFGYAKTIARGHDEKARRPHTGGRRAFSRCGPMRMRRCRYYRGHGTF